jgi:predicted phosphate transport protein (TIGR00153 family)
LCRFEEEADKVTRETITAIHRTFVTPFDRSQILDLITALDDTLDLMKEAGRRLRRYQLAFTPQMRGMADCAVRAATEIRDVMPALGKINRSVERFNAMQRQVRRAETEADDLLDAGLRELFEGSGSPGYKLTVEKVYDLIESVVDRCEDVADVIEGIVIEQV